MDGVGFVVLLKSRPGRVGLALAFAVGVLITAALAVQGCPPVSVHHGSVRGVLEGLKEAYRGPRNAAPPAVEFGTWPHPGSMSPTPPHTVAPLSHLPQPQLSTIP